MQLLSNIMLLLSCLLISNNGSSSLATSPINDTNNLYYATTDSVNTKNINELPRFGNWLFNGSFSKHSFSSSNPNYKITQGDKLLIQVWGAIDFQSEVTVDAQGNIFVPKVGPIKLLGVTNKQVNTVILNNIKRIYKSNVKAYATLLSSQTVKIFLAGMVNQPGLYEGQSADSILRFIDQAKGIRNDLGSYRNIEIIRDNKVVEKIDLYVFLQFGRLPAPQLQDGDTIFVASKQGEVTVVGEVGFKGRYELLEPTTMGSVLNAMSTNDQATHVTIISSSQFLKSVDNEHAGSGNSNNTKDFINNASLAVNAVKYAISEVDNITISAGSIIKVSAQLRPKSISINVEGEHNSAKEVVLPWGASLSDLLNTIEFSSLSNEGAIQLFRESVATRQHEMLQTSLLSLEQSILTAQSNTSAAAEIRKIESENILRWINKAKSVKPKGQVILTDATDLDSVILQQGDRVFVPTKRNLVIIHGEVMFPTAISYDKNSSVQDFINRAGGARKELKDMNILVRKPNGNFVTLKRDIKNSNIVGPGDEIFVLSKPDKKNLQFGKDIVQIMFQIATTAAVFLRI